MIGRGLICGADLEESGFVAMSANDLKADRSALRVEAATSRERGRTR